MKHERFTGLEQRGRVYYLRIRVPSEFADVEPRVEINRSLKTRDRAEAEARCAVAKAALLRDWRARQLRQEVPHARESFDASIELLNDWGLKYRPMQELIEGPIEELLQRVESVLRVGHDAAALPVALGVLDLPHVLLSEMPPEMEKLRAKDVAAKNDRQLREWRAKYERAVNCFKELVSDKNVLEITEADALVYLEHWKNLHAQSAVTANYAAKQLRFMRQMIDGCYSILRVPKSQQSNPFADLKIEKFRYDTAEHGTTKLPLPVAWIRRTVIDESKTPGLNGQARDITIIAADSGTRQAEIYDLPETDIFLDHDIPHILLRVVSEGEQKRQIKNLASTRPVVLLGASLEAMRRNPRGFPQYRGKASYSATVNNYFRDNNLFPALPDAAPGKYTISGTRHTFEDRMKHAGMDNEERAYLMGHSIFKIRGRPVYGSAPDLRMRALYQEMTAFPTPTWQPRPIVELRQEIARLATETGFRVE